MSKILTFPIDKTILPTIRKEIEATGYAFAQYQLSGKPWTEKEILTYVPPFADALCRYVLHDWCINYQPEDLLVDDEYFQKVGIPMHPLMFNEVLQRLDIFCENPDAPNVVFDGDIVTAESAYTQFTICVAV